MVWMKTLICLVFYNVKILYILYILLFKYICLLTIITRVLILLYIKMKSLNMRKVLRECLLFKMIVFLHVVTIKKIACILACK